VLRSSVARLRALWVLCADRVAAGFSEREDSCGGCGAAALRGTSEAVVITGIVAAVSVASLGSKTAPPATSSSTIAGEPLIAYELDRLFRGDRRAVEGDITYARAEAGRILLAADHSRR
jgi:hypothetical protein